MKFRLFGDLETISTIGKGIMNVSLFPPTLVPSVQQQKGSDATRLCVWPENILDFPHCV